MPIRVRRGRSEPEFLPLVRRLGRFLPADVRVLDIVPRASGFRCAVLGAAPSLRLPVVDSADYGVDAAAGALRHRLAAALDVDAMASASRSLVGLHDFAAFCRHREGATTIRDLQRLDWARDGDLITAHVSADAFCWSMVRSLVGAVLAVGEHRRDRRWCAELLSVDKTIQRFRRRAGARA